MGKLLGLGAKSGCGVHTKIQDGVQNGCQKDEFSNFSHIGVKELHKYTHFYVVLLRSNLKSIIRLENLDSNRFLLREPKSITKNGTF